MGLANTIKWCPLPFDARRPRASISIEADCDMYTTSSPVVLPFDVEIDIVFVLVKEAILKGSSRSQFAASTPMLSSSIRLLLRESRSSDVH